VDLSVPLVIVGQGAIDFQFSSTAQDGQLYEFVLPKDANLDSR
jgi:hypothetical protein